MKVSDKVKIIDDAILKLNESIILVEMLEVSDAFRKKITICLHDDAKYNLDILKEELLNG